MKCFLKRTGLLCLVVILLPAISYASIYSGSCGQDVQWKLDTESGLLEIYNSRPEAYSNIPDYYSYSGVPWFNYKIHIRSVSLSGILKIGDSAFYGCSGLTSFTIPESVTSIGSSAFQGCSGLTSVTIPESVTSIGSSAFYGCNGLTSVTISKGVINIGSAAFSGCSGLTSVTIPESVTSIGSSAFRDCSGLTSIIIPEGVTSIRAVAFSGCSGLTSVTIPEGVTTIGESAFHGCSGLTSVTIPESVTSIGDFAFYGCKGLTSVTIPEGVTSIGDFAFSDCSGLTSVTIPEGVTSIGSSAFAYCSGLTSITIPKSVTSIGSYAFAGCSGLTAITIPESVTSIGSSAFSGCYFSRDKFINRSQLSNYNNWGATLYDEETSDGLFIEDHIVVKCRPWVSSVCIPEGVTGIGGSAFYGRSGLTSVTIPESVTSIGDIAFRDCKGLTSITIPESVTSIGSSAFYGCDNLTTLNLDCENVSSWFANNTKLVSLTLGEHVKNIGQKAFSGCTGLRSVTIPANVIWIDQTAFNGCTDIKLKAVRGTDGMLSVWNYGADPYEFGSSELLERPLLSMVSATQTSIIYQVDNVYPEIEYLYDYNSSPLGNNEYLVSGLRPELSQPISLVVKSANNSYSTQFNMETLPISPKLVCEGATASSLSVRGNYTEGDAKVVSISLIVNGKELGQENGTMYELDPNTPYYCEYRVVVEYGNDELYTYYGTDYFSTNELSMVTQQPKVISAGNIIVAAVTNLSEEESKTGFEWRRIDWTDDFTSNYGGAYLYGGRMEGYIRNLNTDKLWKYRAYYESDSGKRYYGQWVGIDPTNTSYFEPTVYTYAQFVVNDNTAEVKGYAMRGTEDVRKQGFMYWKKGSSSIGGISNNIPASAMTVEAKGNVMVATLENLDYDTEYSYVAFATTADNETFYGEEQMFKTGTASQEVIDGIEGTEDADVLTEVARYDLNGRKISSPQKGINIIRQSDGTVKKVMVK